MHLSDVRRPLRLRYYEAAYADRALGPVFEECAVEEYLALARIKYPGASDRSLLARSGVPRLKAVAASHSDVPLVARVEPSPWHLVARQPSCDINQLLAAGHDRILLDLVPSVLNAVPEKTGGTALRALSLNRCGGVVSPPNARLPIDELRVEFCDEPFESRILASYAARAVTFHSDRSVSWDAAQVAAAQTSTSVNLMVPRLVNVQSLSPLPVRDAYLTRVTSAQDLSVLLRAWANAIEELVIGTAVPIPPESFSPCSALKRLLIEARPENASEWIEWAADHPKVGIRFDAAAMITLLTLAVEEVYRCVAIAKAQGKKPRFTVEEDLVDVFDLPFDDNGALEDFLRKAAKKAGKRIAWASESGTLVARAADLDTARWVVDAALDTATTADPRN